MTDTVKSWIECPACKGDGAVYEQVRVGQFACPFVCTNCNGDGEVRMACPEVLGGLKYTSEEVMEFTSDAPPPAPSQRPRTQKQRERANQPQQASAQGSGRDWLAELYQCATADELRKLYTACSAARELTPELAEQITTAGRTLAATEKQDEGEVVDGQLIDEETGEVKAA